MNFFKWVLDQLNIPHADGKDFGALLAERNISRAISMMTHSGKTVDGALAAYDVRRHSINERKDKPVFDGEKKFLRFDKKWKIPIPYAQYINEIALVFLYGRPLKLMQRSEGTDRAFEAFVDRIESSRFDSRIRQAKRLAGAETQSALLFHVFRNEDGNPDLLIKVLARSLGDDIYFRKDQFGRLTAFARGYSLVEAGGQTVYHTDIYTKEKIYLCRRESFGWAVEEQDNSVRKIPVILLEQETEFANTEAMIERREWMISHLADVNDRFSSPTLVAISDNLMPLADKMEDSKMIHIKPSLNGERADVRYLTWDAASESKKLEGDELDRQILNKTFTPDISPDQIRNLSNLSGKALKQLMMLAVIKAEMRKETHDEYASRIASLMKAIIGNVLDIRLKAECEALTVRHEFQEPFGEDVKGVIDNLVKMYGAGGMSQETLIEMNPVIKDAELEKKRIAKEEAQAVEAEARRAKFDVFGAAG